jgi:uncharacterized protein
VETSDLTVRTADKLVAQLFDVIDGCRWDELRSVLDETCVYSRPGYEPIVGLPEIERFYREVRVIGSGRHLVECVVADLGAAACWGTFQGRSRSGAELEEGFADTYRVRDGRITYRRTYFYRPAI